MDRLLYWMARTAVGFIQRLPLRWAARLGRAGGAAAYWLDARHRRVALRNLALGLGADKSREELRRLARENFRRIGENYVSAIKTASMSDAELADVLTVLGAERLVLDPSDPSSRNCIVAIGHFGNFELYARRAMCIKGLKPATTYRGLKQPALNRLLQSLRERSGCGFYERRTDAKALREALNGSGMLLGLLADQHAGDRGLWVPFLGRECSTSAAPAVFALRYHSTLYTAICFRKELARWVIEVGDQIPTHSNGQARPVEEITHDMNRAFEKAVLRDPANWFWVHQRWKPRKVPVGGATTHDPKRGKASTDFVTTLKS
jgi:KDO2-lipid IV(A) lauroyltransferase